MSEHMKAMQGGVGGIEVETAEGSTWMKEGSKAEWRNVLK
jgi:hypothetical protein